jgi:hypothetical protein
MLIQQRMRAAGPGGLPGGPGSSSHRGTRIRGSLIWRRVTWKNCGSRSMTTTNGSRTGSMTRGERSTRKDALKINRRSNARAGGKRRAFAARSSGQWRRSQYRWLVRRLRRFCRIASIPCAVGSGADLVTRPPQHPSNT